jgi:P-type conjugative transfer protein TrbJ
MAKSSARHLTRAVAALLAVPLFLSDSRTAQAQFAVIDAANLAQNIMTEVHTLQTTVNQATQIANQITQLAHEATNLINLPAALAAQLLNAYMGAFTALNQTWSSINGLAGNIVTLTARYNTLYPNRQIGGTVTPAQVIAQTQNFLIESRTELQGADQLAAQVAAQMPSNQTQLSTAVTSLNSSPGALNAIQSAGQIEAVTALELAQTNALILGMNQAQVSMLAQEVQDRDDAEKRATDLAVQYPAAPASPVPYVP